MGNLYQQLNENTKEVYKDNVIAKVKDLIVAIVKYIRHIQWAPLNVPLRRRLQTFAAFMSVFIFVFLPVISLLLTIFLMIYLNYIGRTLLVIYFVHIIYYNKFHYSDIHGNGWLKLRHNCLSDHLRDYFPVELIKTADLRPDRNYLLAAFPHGIISTGISINMVYNIGPWLKMFPGIRPKIATLNSIIYIPFMREVYRILGAVSCSKDSLMYYLSKSNDPKNKENKDGFTSNAIAILVGGAQEAFYSRPGNYAIQLKNRKGFVKIAIKTGSPIVPTFTFGEVNIFNQLPIVPDSLLCKMQAFVKRITGVAPVLVMGRGFFQYSFGCLPHRKHLVQVVGAPIEVEKQENPSAEYIDEIHQKVIDSVNEIFEKYKFKYIDNAENVNLVIN